MSSILIVDDSKFCRKLMRIPLERAGFAVTETEAPDQALLLLEDEALPALMITDLKMPQLEDGLNFLMVVAMINDQLPILVCSADQTNQYDLDNFGFKQLIFMAKPIQSETLLQNVRFLLSNS